MNRSSPPSNPRTRKNVVLVVVDCLRGDFVGTDRADTPFIDRLVRDGIDYSSMFATTSTTTPCVASFLTGRYSERNGVYSLRDADLRDDVPTLPERLSDGDYSAYAMATGPVVEETGLDRGFDRFWYRDRNENLTGGWRDEAHRKVQTLESPFFLYLHLWELHWPIDVPDEFDRREYGQTRYARMLSALDRELESLVEALPEDTVLLLHGDHGESISWHYSRIHGHHNQLQKYTKKARDYLRYTRGYDTRRAERAVNRFFRRLGRDDLRDHFVERGHGETTYDFMTHVPLVVAGSDAGPATVDAQCRQVDIYPTVLELAGMEYDGGIDGEPLYPPTTVDDRVAYIRACGSWLRGKENWSRAVRADGMKYVEYPERDWPWELYDLDEDPCELHPIDDADKAEELAREMPRRGHRGGDRLEIDDLLEDLGYL